MSKGFIAFGVFAWPSIIPIVGQSLTGGPSLGHGNVGVFSSVSSQSSPPLSALDQLDRHKKFDGFMDSLKVQMNPLGGASVAI